MIYSVGYVTVYSGRTGIAVEQAPMGLLRHLLGSEEQREVLVERFDLALVTSVSLANLHVSGERELLAVVHLGASAGTSRVLSQN